MFYKIKKRFFFRYNQNYFNMVNIFNVLNVFKKYIFRKTVRRLTYKINIDFRCFKHHDKSIKNTS